LGLRTSFGPGSSKLPFAKASPGFQKMVRLNQWDVFYKKREWTTMLNHKGYTGHIEFDDEAGLFHGEVVDTRDVVTFQGRSVDEIVQAFRDSVDDYLDFCAERGEKPDKPFSGKFVLRIHPELHHAFISRPSKCWKAWT
jgi:predicted HicB family RNase H-like nuclease